MVDLLLRLGFGQINRTFGANEEIREIEARQAIVTHITQAGEVMPRFAEFAECLHPAIGLRPFDEGVFQPTTTRWPTLVGVDALTNIH